MGALDVKFGKKDKPTDSEKKKAKALNKQLANPERAALNKASADAKRQRRAESGSVKVINR
jgi:hypothetical protein